MLLLEVYVSVSVCPHDNLKIITGICFLLGSFVDWEKSRTSSHVRITDQGQLFFSEGSRYVYELFCDNVISNGKSYCCDDTFWRSDYVAAIKEYLRKIQITLCCWNQHFISYFVWNFHSNWLLFLRIMQENNSSWFFFCIQCIYLTPHFSKRLRIAERYIYTETALYMFFLKFWLQFLHCLIRRTFRCRSFKKTWDGCQLNERVEEHGRSTEELCHADVTSPGLQSVRRSRKN